VTCRDAGRPRSTTEAFQTADARGLTLFYSHEGKLNRIGSISEHYDAGGRRFLYNRKDSEFYCASFVGNRISCISAVDLSLKWKSFCEMPQYLSFDDEKQKIFVACENRCLVSFSKSSGNKILSLEDVRSVNPLFINQWIVLDRSDKISLCDFAKDISLNFHKSSFAVMHASVLRDYVAICETGGFFFLYSVDHDAAIFVLENDVKSPVKMQHQRCSISEHNQDLYLSIFTDCFQNSRELKHYSIKGRNCNLISSERYPWLHGFGEFDSGGVFYFVNGVIVIPPWLSKK
jgi:hypothetical protein